MNVPSGAQPTGVLFSNIKVGTDPVGWHRSPYQVGTEDYPTD